MKDDEPLSAQAAPIPPTQPPPTISALIVHPRQEIPLRHPYTIEAAIADEIFAPPRKRYKSPSPPPPSPPPSPSFIISTVIIITTTYYKIPTTRQGLNRAAIEQLIAQRLADAITTYEANQNSGNGANNETSGSAGEQKEPLAYLTGLRRWVGLDTAYETLWKELKQMMNDEYNPMNEVKKMETKLWNLYMVTPKYKKIEMYIWGLTNDIQGNVTSSKLTKIQESICMDHDLIDQDKRKEVVRAFTARTVKRERYYMNECSKLKNQNCGNQNGNRGARGRAFLIDTREARQDPNVVTGTFLLNNHHDSILFDTGANRSFVSTAFSPLINIAPTSLDVKYNIELPHGKTLKLYVIIGMDCLSKYHAMIVYDENLKYLQKCWHVFLAHIKEKKSEEKSEEKQLEGVHIIRDFPEVFPEDFPRLSPTIQVEFQIELVTGVAPVLTLKNQYPLLRIGYLFDQLQGSSIYSKIDL
ncbi:putative reverse transcriptase domain-containing protein [Tanacetum coccineum]|uniref:Reverse transcriptase domain-containing protein n=1 Tax=Tanacetum coccineum TaxID=301880 RepID=A0ABQ5I813_9ASTR